MALKMINVSLSTTISYSYMILGPCHNIYNILKSKDTMSKISLFWKRMNMILSTTISYFYI